MNINFVVKTYEEFYKKLKKLTTEFFNEEYINELEEECQKMSLVFTMLNYQGLNYIMYLLYHFMQRIKKSEVLLSYENNENLNLVADKIKIILNQIKDKEEQFMIEIEINSLLNFSEKLELHEKIYIINNDIFDKYENFYTINEKLIAISKSNNKIEDFKSCLNHLSNLISSLRILVFKKNLEKIKRYVSSLSKNISKKELYYINYIIKNISLIKDFVEREKTQFKKSEKKISLNLDKLNSFSNEIKDPSLKKEFDNLYLIDFKILVEELRTTVEDIGNLQNKKIKLSIKGNLKIYTIYKEKIKFSLLHLFRNSADHGIEESDIRLKQGKEEYGNILVKLSETNKDFIIELCDDGKGIDCEKIQEKALEKSLFTKDELSNMTESQIINLIFYPNFSTAIKVTQISGRGVGMEAVKKNIDELDGNIILSSVKNKGSSFKITIPK